MKHTHNASSTLLHSIVGLAERSYSNAEDVLRAQRQVPLTMHCAVISSSKLNCRTEAGIAHVVTLSDTRALKLAGNRQNIQSSRGED